MTVREGNIVLDSLKSRADWERSYRTLYSQYLLAKDHVDDLDSTVVTVNAHCDSVVKNGFRRENELIAENTGLRRELVEEKSAGKASKVEKWTWRIVAVLLGIAAITK